MLGTVKESRQPGRASYPNGNTSQHIERTAHFDVVIGVAVPVSGQVNITLVVGVDAVVRRVNDALV